MSRVPPLFTAPEEWGKGAITHFALTGLIEVPSPVSIRRVRSGFRTQCGAGRRPDHFKHDLNLWLRDDWAINLGAFALAPLPVGLLTQKMLLRGLGLILSER
jgi:hypothetical protein